MIIQPRSGLHSILKGLLLNGTGFPHQSSGFFRPSEASATIHAPYGQKTIGHCPRATWYRLKKIPPSNVSTSLHAIQRMDIGKAVENDFVEKAKLAGIFVDRNVPFKETFFDIPVAAEMDVVCRTEPRSETRYCTECKSISGYNAQKQIFGRALGLSRKPGAPRNSYLMQISLYLMKFSFLPEDNPAYLPFGTIYVCDRGDGHFGTFDVWLQKETRFPNNEEEIEVHKILYSSEDLDIPTTTCSFTVEDILQSFRTVTIHLKNNTPPPKGFIREYNKDQVEARFEAGEISKSAYDKWKKSHGPRGKKKEVLGSWRCFPLYCKWSDLCNSEE